MRLTELLDSLQTLGARAPHQELFLRSWLAGTPLGEHAAHHRASYPKALQAALPELEQKRAALLSLVQERPSSGTHPSTARLYQLHDQERIESVHLPRGAVCVSTQVGCAVGCLFCQTGKNGLARNLSSLEICAQVTRALSAGHPVRRVVLMGMGEPLHNLPQVLEAIDLLAGPGLLPHKQITLSTVGSLSLFDRLLSRRVRPSIALSLHSLDPRTRQTLLPHAPPEDPLALIEAADRYARATGWPIQYQWTLIRGLNDRPEDLRALIDALASRKGILNLIPVNPIEGETFQPPQEEKRVHFVRALKRAGVYSSIRKSAGQDVRAACGQLRGSPKPNG